MTPALFVTNFNRNFTGVSATAATVLRQQAGRYDLRLVGAPLPGAPMPVTVAQARRLCRTAPPDHPFAIWHVRRNTEMRAALWARDVLRLPVRIVFTSAARRRHSALPRWLIGRMDSVIATSRAAAGFVPNVQAVVPHGVDTDLFVPASDRAAAWRALPFGGARGIATIGRIRPEKGTDRFVAAMLELLPQFPDLTALVVGRAAGSNAGFLERLKAQVADAGLSNRLLFIGEMPAPELPALMRALSLVMQLPVYEGYGMVPLEAMASGTPFVATQAGHYREFSAQGRCGAICETDQAAITAARILNDTARHAAMTRAAADVARTSFSAAREADGIGAVYEALWRG